MNSLFKNGIAAFVIVWVSVFLVVGCGHFNKHPGRKPIKIDNAAVGINFDTKGKIVYVGEDGKEFHSRPFKEIFEALSEFKAKKDSEWKVDKVRAINVYYVEGSHYIIYEADGEGVCLEYSDTWVYQGPCPF